MPQKLQIRRRATFPRFYLSVFYHMFNQLVPCFGASPSDVNDLNVLLMSKQLISFIQSFSKDKEKLFMILVLLFWFFSRFSSARNGNLQWREVLFSCRVKRTYCEASRMNMPKSAHFLPKFSTAPLICYAFGTVFVRSPETDKKSCLFHTPFQVPVKRSVSSKTLTE